MTCPLRERSPLWATLTATFLGIGLVKPGPGTWASALTLAFWWAVTHCLPVRVQPPMALMVALFAIAIGIPAATRLVRSTGLKDPQFVVIDEVAGQLVALAFVPVSWKSLLAAFILFRSFDILKPPPVRSLEKLPAGFGVVMDDVGAGLYALIIMQLLLHFGWLPR